MKNQGQVHIPGAETPLKSHDLDWLEMFCINMCVLLSRTGVGDFQVTDINFLPDPCPLPDAQKKRGLNEKERLLYAPLAGVGGLVYDKDAVYIDLPANHVNQQVHLFDKLNHIFE